MEEIFDQVMEPEVQETDLGSMWDGEDMADQTGDQRLEEPEEGSTQTGGEPATEGQGGVAPQESGDGTEPKEEKPTDGGQTSPQAESFTLRHLDDPPVTVDREGVVRLAQQGLDYGRVRTERDQLREYRTQAEPALNVLKAFAEHSGMTLEEYVDFCRVQTIMEGGVNEATARAQVEVEKQRVQLDAQQRADQEEQQRQEQAQQQEQQRAQARRRDMEAFLEAYPEVKAEDVPREVWEKVAAGESLVSAYAMYRNQQLEAQIAAMRQNGANAARAPGSMKSQGEKGRKTLEDYWDETED